MPVIPSFRGIESATQDALDKAFQDSAKKSGQVFADEHEKAFRQKAIENARTRINDSQTTAANKRVATDAGQKAGDAYNDAFNKTRAEDTAAPEAATKSGTEAGKASGRAAGKAHNDELKKTTAAESDSIGKAIGGALGAGAGRAAAEALEDALPKALQGTGLSGLGASLGEQLGGAIGDHLTEIPGKIKDGLAQARTVITGSAEGIKGAITGIKTVADHVHDSTFHIGDGVKVAADALRGLNITSLTTGLDRVSTMVTQAEPVAAAFGVDISSWPGDINQVVGPAQTLSDTFTAAKGAVSGTADALAVLAEGSPAVVAALEGISAAAGPIAIMLGGIAAGVYGLSKLRDYIATGAGDRPAGVTPDEARALWNGASPGQVANPNIPTAPGGLGLGTELPAGSPAPPRTGIPTLLPGTGTTPPLRGNPDGSSTASTPGGNLSDLLGGSEGGGGIFGPGPKGKDSVLMWGAPGEHMWTAPEVDAVGGHARMEELRAAARAGALRGYDQGGAVGNPPGLERYVDAMSGTKYDTTARTDCSGMASRIASVYLGLPPQPAFTTQSEASWLAQHGAIPGMGPPGSLRFGWYNHGSGTMDGHTAVTLPDGRNAESGGSHGGFLVGGGAAGADNPEFDQHAYFPRNPQGMTTAGGGVASGIAGGADGGAGGMAGVGGGAGAGGGVGGAGGLGGAASTAAGGKAGGPMSAFNKAGGIGGAADIGKQFLSDTFGFGTILPGLDEFPPTQFLFGMLDSLLGTGGGGSGTGGILGNMLGGAINPGGGGFGMIPGMGGDVTPGGVGPPAFDPALPGLSAGLGDAGGPGGNPMSVDQSTHLTVNGRSDDDMITKVRRELINNPPRAMTNTPPGH